MMTHILRFQLLVEWILQIWNTETLLIQSLPNVADSSQVAITQEETQEVAMHATCAQDFYVPTAVANVWAEI